MFPLPDELKGHYYDPPGDRVVDMDAFFKTRIESKQYFPLSYGDFFQEEIDALVGFLDGRKELLIPGEFEGDEGISIVVNQDSILENDTLIPLEIITLKERTGEKFVETSFTISKTTKKLRGFSGYFNKYIRYENCEPSLSSIRTICADTRKPYMTQLILWEGSAEMSLEDPGITCPTNCICVNPHWDIINLHKSDHNFPKAKRVANEMLKSTINKSVQLLNRTISALIL